MADDHQNKQDLLADVRRERAKLDALFAPLDEPGMMAVAREEHYDGASVRARRERSSGVAPIA